MTQDKQIAKQGERTSDAPPPLERATIGRYEIVYPLASGGMASIYVGRLSGMAGFEKLVTLKIIHPHLATQRQFVEMFFDEARLAAKIHHPNIGEIYEIVEDDGQLFMAAEFVDGRSLRHLLRAAQAQETPVPHSVAAWICAEVCQGLGIVHDLTGDDGESLNLVHRDISPSNILVAYSGWVKLIDFGIAFAENRLAHTIPGNVKGKIGYISPEQLKGAPLDRRADIFAIGVILYQIVTGRHPFPGASDGERLRKTLQYELVSPSNLSSGVDADLEAIIMTAMAERPEHRYKNATSLERDLRQYIAATREITGASDVAHLMHTLFSSSKALHQERISAFRQNTPSAPREYRPDWHDTPYSISTNKPPDALKTRFAKARNQKPRFPRMHVALFTVISGVAASVLTAVAFHLFSGASGTSPDRQPDDADALEGHMTFVKPAEVFEAPAGSKREPAPHTEPAGSAPAVGAPEEITITVSLTPPETELLLDGEIVEIEASSIKLPGNGRRYSVVAQAPGYVSETHSVIAADGETLSVTLSPSSVSRPSKQRRASKSPKKARKKRGVVRRVLKENPY